MTMTIMKSDLKRWLTLFEWDANLQPLGLDYESRRWWLETPVSPGNDIGEFTEPMPIQDEHAELLIIAKAIRWFNTKHEGLTIGDGSWDEEYSGPWPSGFSVQVFSPMIDEIRSDERLIDALYKAVVAVKSDQERIEREDRQRNSRLGRLKRKLRSIFEKDTNDDFGRC